MSISIESMQGKSVVPSESVLAQEVEGQVILLDLQGGHYFGMNHVGVKIWNLLQQGKQPGEILQDLLDQFGVAEARLRKDVEAFIGELHQSGLVQVRDAEPS